MNGHCDSTRRWDSFVKERFVKPPTSMGDTWISRCLESCVMSGREARKLVAIHQPNFFPWLGYFNKIARADIFIVLDNVQFSKTGGTWSNRVRFLLQGQPTWATVPVERSFHGVRLVCEMRVANGPWWARLLRAFRGAYRRAPYFHGVFL